MTDLAVKQQNIRNIAIIAHVDHGKTTLVDAFLKQTHLFRESQAEMQQERILDTGDLEKEKGITIKAKNASIYYKDYKINIIDTPGHSDFGGEVERTLNMADGCLLLVDAQDGPMPQTKFVLRKALSLGIKPIVVINKIDKRFAEPKKVLEKVSDLFLELAENEDQLDFPVFYAVAREGKVFESIPTAKETDSKAPDVSPIFEKIIECLPAPSGDENAPFRMQVTSIDYDDHLGRFLVGKVDRGIAKVGMSVVVVDEEKKKLADGVIKSLRVREGLDFKDVNVAGVGQIILVSGLDANEIGATLCSSDKIDPLPSIQITPASLKIKFEASTSPFRGVDGKFVNFKQLQQRLEKEAENNIALEITSTTGGYFVGGRGELQLSILIETMRREGYEFQVRKPQVVIKTINGKKMQPKEELFIDVPQEYISGVTKLLMERNAEILNIETAKSNARITAHILTARLFGLRNQLITMSRNQAAINNYVIDYVEYTNEEEPYRNGALVSMAQGTAASYALNTIQNRGVLFIEPSEEVYEGMIIGINKYSDDLEVNPTKTRHQTCTRTSSSEVTRTALHQPKKLTLEFALVFLNKDEILLAFSL